MNFYTSAIVSTNVIGAWDTYLLWRQKNSYKSAKLPPALRTCMSADEFAKAQLYGEEKTGLAIIDRLHGLIISNATLLWRVSATLYKMTAQLSGFSLGTFAHCFTYAVASDVIGTLLDLPLSYYRHFVLEDRYGFNKMTRWEFAKDALKSLALRVALLHPLQTGLIQWVVRRFGEAFPLYFFASMAVITIAFTLVYPVLIQPLFNTFTELDENSELCAKIRNLAARVQFPLKKVYTVDGSRRSNHSNAYFQGFYRNIRIVLFDTLIEQLGDDSDQILAVLCHEFGHWKLNHTYYLLGVGLGQLFAFSRGAKCVIFNQDMYRQFGFTTMDPVIGFDIFSQVFLEPLSLFIEYPMNFVSRCFEFQADRFAVSLGYGERLKSSLIVMTKENKAVPTADPLYSALKFSHPPTSERIAVLDELLDAEVKKQE